MKHTIHCFAWLLVAAVLLLAGCGQAAASAGAAPAASQPPAVSVDSSPESRPTSTAGSHLSATGPEFFDQIYCKFVPQQATRDQVEQFVQECGFPYIEDMASGGFIYRVYQNQDQTGDNVCFAFSEDGNVLTGVEYDLYSAGPDAFKACSIVDTGDEAGLLLVNMAPPSTADLVGSVAEQKAFLFGD